MLWYIAIFVVICFIAFVSFFLGRSLAILFNFPWVVSSKLEALIGSVFLGTGALTLMAAWLSYLGWTAQQSFWPVTLACLVITGLAWVRSRGWSRFWVSPRAICGAAVILLLSNACYLIPISRNSYVAFNDTFTYVSISDILQNQSFAKDCRYISVEDLIRDKFKGEVVLNPFYTGQVQYCMYRQETFRMGANFFLSLLQSGLGKVRAFDVFPAAVGWCLVLLGLSAFLLVRWSFRLPVPLAVLVACMAVAIPNPVTLAASDGFYPQAFGLPLFSFVLALLSRMLRTRRLTARHALLFSLAMTFLISVYTEIFPLAAVVAIAVGCATAIRLWRRGALGSFVRFSAAVMGSFLVLANIEVYHLFHALPKLVHIVTGYHFDWRWSDFLAFAFGIRLTAGASIPYGNSALCMLGFLAAALFVAGVWRILGRRGFALLMALACYLGLAVYFAFFVKDPWSGQLGQTFSLYKLCCWSSPLLLVIESIGISFFYTRNKWTRRLIPLAIVLVIVLLIPKWFARCRGRAWDLEDATHSSKPFEAYREAINLVNTTHPSIIYLETPKGSVWPKLFVAYLFYPEQTVMVGEDYAKDYFKYIEGNPGDPVIKAWEANPAYVGVAENYYNQATPLPGGLILGSVEKPMILQIQTDKDGLSTLELWARYAAVDRLHLRLKGPGHLEIRLNGRVLPIANSGGAKVAETDLTLNAGYNYLTFASSFERDRLLPIAGIEDLKIVSKAAPLQAEKH